MRDPATGKWSRPGKRPNEAFDLCVYNLVVFILLKGEKINWDAPPPWAEQWDTNMLVFAPNADDATVIEQLRSKASPKKRRRRVVKPRQ